MTSRESIRRPHPGFAALCVLAACTVLLGCPGGTTDPPPTGPPPTGPPPTDPAPQCEAVINRAEPSATGIDDRSLRPEERIVGGLEAAIDNFPWAAAIALQRLDGSLFQFCGGSLIAPDWVLTAAHCKVSSGDKVILGRQDLTTDEGTVHDVEFAINHRDYNPDTQENDISLVKLATSSGQAPVGIVDAADTNAKPDDPSTVIGWGRLAEGAQTSNTLQEVEIPIVTNATCQDGYASDGIDIAATMLCAGLEAGQRDSCQGDSGGPLMVRATAGDPWEQAGVVSFGIGCARPGKFGVYTRVSQYRGWLEACQANPPS